MLLINLKKEQFRQHFEHEYQNFNNTLCKRNEQVVRIVIGELVFEPSSFNHDLNMNMHNKKGTLIVWSNHGTKTKGDIL